MLWKNVSYRSLSKNSSKESRGFDLICQMGPTISRSYYMKEDKKTISHFEEEQNPGEERDGPSGRMRTKPKIRKLLREERTN